jgi:glyoxylate reductase
MAHVFVTRKIPGDALERLAAEHDVEVWPGDMPPPREDLLAGVAEAEGLLSMLVDKVDSELLDAAPNLRAVANYAIGFDNIDLEATRPATSRSATRPTCSPTPPPTCAGRSCSRSRGASSRRAGTPARAGGARGSRRAGSGPTSMARRSPSSAPGASARPVAKRAAGFDMEVLMVDLGDDLHSALERADFVSIHTPLTPETHHLIDAGALARMKPTAILVNTARGRSSTRTRSPAALRDGRLAARASTSPTPSRSHPTTRCTRRRTCSSSPTSAPPRPPRAPPWPIARSTTCSRRSTASRCPTRCSHRPEVRVACRRHRDELDAAASSPMSPTTAP